MLKIALQLPEMLHQDTELWTRILPRFQKEAGELIVQSVRDELGSPEIYSLSEPYRDQKPRRKGFQRVAGKAPDQPLIFSGAMFEAISAHAEGEMLIVQVADGEALAKDGDDYAEQWEEVTHFLEKGFAKVEGLLAELLMTIIVEEMLL
jgi:hypothetical protein